MRHERISSQNGHDTFLIDYELITPQVSALLSCSTQWIDRRSSLP